MSTQNVHEVEARNRKAVALASLLVAFGATPEFAEEMTARDRLDIATAAGVRTPSEETWAQAVRCLRTIHDTRARFTADPFQGLPT